MQVTKLVSAKEVLTRVSIGKTLLWKTIREGRLETVKIGRRTLITEDSLERLISSGSKGVRC